MPEQPPTVCPCLSYRDAAAAIEFLTAAFGFETLVVYPGEEGRIEHSELRFGNGVIMLGSAKPERGWASPRDLTGVNQALYVAVHDVDGHYLRAKAAGAEIVREPADTDYGSRDYEARDPEGHHWFFGTYVPSLTPKEPVRAKSGA